MKGDDEINEYVLQKKLQSRLGVIFFGILILIKFRTFLQYQKILVLNMLSKFRKNIYEEKTPYAWKAFKSRARAEPRTWFSFYVYRLFRINLS